jgi:threonyl-tRNA synthetase
MRDIQRKRDYQEIYTPPLVHQKLWQQSGHWDLYRENMFLVEADDAIYSLKPMNCPESTFIYRSRVRSYREFPLRLSEYGVLHRYELSGVRSGLTRVRHFYTDDAHIYVTPAQIQDEILALMGEVTEFYGWFGLEPTLTFGTRPAKALGDEATWRETEGMMLEALKASGVKYRVKPGDGAFYAPKIDIQIEDALGREWQTATIQVDRLMLPERFDLHYIDENGERQRPVAIHRAILGSLERFIGVITEHFAGAFPFWCAPVQAVVIPIADRHNEAAASLADVLRAKGVRVEVDDSSNRMQNKIRLAQEQKVPYMLVLGDREIEARTAAARTRAGEQQAPIGWEELAERLAGEAVARRPD